MKKIVGRISSFVATILAVVLLATGTANALTVTWAFLFPIPIPLPVWSVEHPHGLITYGFLFPVWLPLPFFDYGPKGPNEPKFQSSDNVYIDGRYAGTLKDYGGAEPVLALPDGPHTFEIMEKGSPVYTARFDVKGGKVQNMADEGGER